MDIGLVMTPSPSVTASAALGLQVASGGRARRTAEAAGRDPDSLRFGAFVNCVVNADRDMPRDVAATSIQALSKVVAAVADAA